jgi:glycosyltransferase involved in cell wall biosynthesis
MTKGAIPILHVCDKFGVAGSSIHGVSRLFSWWFPRYGPRFAPSLIGLKHPEPATAWLAAQGVPVHHLGRGRFDPRILTDLVRVGRARGARILHVHGYAASDFGRLAARRVGAGLVLHEHFADPRMPAYQGLADRALASLTDRAIAVSQSTADFLVQQRHVPKERVRLIWNGAPLDDFAPVDRERARATRRALGLPDDAVVVGSIARLNEQKGHRYLVDAAALLLARRPDVRDLLGAIDVFAIASTYEGTPLSLFEAMAAGKTIVSTAVDGCREVLEDGVTGLLVPPRDPGALAAALLRVVEDPALAGSLADSARSASTRYDARDCVRRIEALYDEVLSEMKRRSGRAA